MTPDLPVSTAPTRRRVIGGAAWAVPAVAAAAAAPAMAASCSAHTVLTAAALNIEWVDVSSGGQVTADTYLSDFDLIPSLTAGRRGWQMHANTALSHTLLTYSVSITTPYRVTWSNSPTGISGWVRSEVVTTSPNRWTYTWTAVSPLLPRTMVATTPITSTSANTTNSLVLPTFNGSVTHADLIAFRPVGTQWVGNPWSYPTAYTSTYQFNASSGCSTGVRSYGRTGALNMNHT